VKLRRLGHTGIEISELVFGGGFVGGILIHADDDTRREAVRRALDAGINWIDTAPSYGQGQSETALGWLLGELDEQPYLSTKVGLDPAKLDDIPGHIERSLEQSLIRLRRDSVDLLQLHNPLGPPADAATLNVEDVLKENGVADTFERLKSQGLVRFVGITALGDAAACRQVIDSARFDTAQVYYNMLNPGAGRKMPAKWTGHSFDAIIAACRRRDMGIMAIRILAAGVLASDVRTGREIPVSTESGVAKEEQRTRAVFAVLEDAYGTRAQTAVRFALANPDVSCAIVGLATLEHLEQALAGAESGPLPEDAIARLDRVYESGFEHVE
jgi:L-galactose dehydrogenase/L-glyceraldehyde 3-phosphate reductase